MRAWRYSVKNVEKAIEVLRKKSVLKAEKKSGRATNEGAIVIGSSDDVSFIVEVDTETDFAAKDASFQNFLEDLTIFCTKHTPSDLDDLNEKYNAQLLEIIQKIGENIKISYFEKLTIDGAVLASYKHSDNRLAAIVKLDSGDESLGRDIAMQVAANNPMAIYPDDIDQKILEKPLLEYCYKKDELEDPLISKEHIFAFNWATRLSLIHI